MGPGAEESREHSYRQHKKVVLLTMLGEKSSVQLLEKLVCNENLLPTVTRRGNGKEEPP